MGFTAVQARHALRRTDTGHNVQQAVDILLDDAHGKSRRTKQYESQHVQSSIESGRRSRQPPRSRGIVEDSEILPAHPSERVHYLANSGEALPPHPEDQKSTRWKKKEEVYRASVAANSSDEESRWQDMPTYSDGDSRATRARQNQSSTASKLSQIRAQANAQDLGKLASELSVQFRNRAEVFWKQGKEMASKAMEEYQHSVADSRRAESDISTPRWMHHASSYDEDAKEINFRAPMPEDKAHHNDRIAQTLEARLLEEQGPPPGIQRLATLPDNDRSRHPPPMPARPKFTDTADVQASRPSSAASLRSQRMTRASQFDDMPQYQSSARQGRPRRAPASAPTTSRSTPIPETVNGPVSPKKSTSNSTLKQKSSDMPVRPVVSIPTMTLDEISLARKSGTEAFKRGDFVLACSTYTQALDLTPTQHLLRCVLLSNRAAAHLRLGDPKSALVDANEGIAIIGPTRGTNEQVEPGKPLVDIWGKLAQRRAEALEQLEKFKEARTAWDTLVQNSMGGKVALDGRRRCELALEKDSPSPAGSSASSRLSSPATSARTTPAPVAKKPTSAAIPRSQPLATSIEDSVAAQAALKRLREADKQNDAAEAEKFSLFDKVEAKVNTWKYGKEENLRALLGSLDTILWAETGWQKVTIADLVVPKRVKINYMKAVAKTHPDKVAPDATTEQKMIAQSVFVALNHAWDVFKLQNNIQ
ncbi:uncharacterized protein V1516DRAFT_442046 [Lipomyces oligophaga]|uniref:uncharacterized protein n=1 Tax=Lipomyces oligophaga TaxID=45792 RepID=UPI0034CDEDD7